MKHRLLTSLSLLVANAGLALAQVQQLPQTAPAAPVVGDPSMQPPCAPCAVDMRPQEKTDGDSVWVSTEYLLWWVKSGPSSTPLVTRGDPTDPTPGALGRPGTTPLFGNDSFNYGTFSGLRLTGGVWLDREHIWGFEASAFLLEQRSDGFSAGSDAAGNPPLYHPVFRADRGSFGSFAISDPRIGVTGSTAIDTHTRLWGAEANVLGNLARQPGSSFDVLAGFRTMNLTEGLSLSDNLNDPINNIRDVIHDQFSTRNQFYGGQLGGRASCQFGRASLDVIGKIALGVNHEVVTVSGSTTESGGPKANVGTFPGGIYTQPTNIGQRSQDDFTVIPECELKLSWQVVDHVKVFVGYDIIYWSQTVRPGSQIDPAVNPTQSLGGKLAGPASPMAVFNRSDYWAQGVSFGLELRF